MAIILNYKLKRVDKIIKLIEESEMRSTALYPWFSSSTLRS